MRPPAFSPADSPVRPGIEVAGVSLVPTRCGGLWRPDTGLLVVSDLHLEKGSYHAARGEMLPPYDSIATLSRLAGVMAELRPRCVVALGDSFHDAAAGDRLGEDTVSILRDMTGACEWIWIAGNHDPSPPANLGGRILPVFRQEGLTYRHEPSLGVEAAGEVCGHLHPCAVVAGRGRSVRTRCFATDGRRIVLPAYGALAGGLNVLDPAFGAIFPDGLTVATLGRSGVYLASMSRLLPDRTGPGQRRPSQAATPPTTTATAIARRP